MSRFLRDDPEIDGHFLSENPEIDGVKAPNINTIVLPGILP